MIEITLTTFINYISAPDKRKRQEVKKAQYLLRSSHDSKGDYYLPLRSKFISAVKGNTNTDEILKYVTDSAPKDRQANYNSCVLGFAKFSKNNIINWCPPVSGEITYRNLTMRVKPELGLKISGNQFATKLYFKKESLDQHTQDLILYIIKSATSKYAGDYSPSILLTRSGEFVCRPHRDVLYKNDFEEYAHHFISTWNNLDNGE